MCADAPEFVVKRVQVFAQQPHNFHAEIAVFAQKLLELPARRRRLQSFKRRQRLRPLMRRACLRRVTRTARRKHACAL